MSGARTLETLVTQGLLPQSHAINFVLLLISKESKIAPQQPPVLQAIARLPALIVLPWGLHQYRHEVDRRQAAVVADALAAAPSYQFIACMWK